MLRSVVIPASFLVSLWISHAHAELEGIAFHIADGEINPFSVPLELSQEQKDQFQSLRIESRAELATVWQGMRGELRHLRDEEDHKKWQGQFGPTIKQINYDLWQRAAKILSSDEQRTTYYRLLLQYYLQNGRELRCIASLAGIDLSLQQIQELKTEFSTNQLRLDNLVANRRREIEEEVLKNYIDRDTFVKLRGEEFNWTNSPPSLPKQRVFPIEEFGDIVPDLSMIFIATHSDVLDALDVDPKTEQILDQALKQANAVIEKSPSSPFDFLGVGNGKAQKAIAEELKDRKLAAEEELTAQLRACLSTEQIQRLTQIGMQQKLRRFQYLKAMTLVGKTVDSKKTKDLRRAADEAKREIEFAKRQLLMDLNARSFDKTAKTNLSTSLGRFVADQQGQYASFVRNGEQPQTAAQLYGQRYGTPATTVLAIPLSLSKAPEETVEWNHVDVPKGLTLEQALANVEKCKRAAQQIADGQRTWEQRRREISKEIRQAMQNGDEELAKELRSEQMREFSGLMHMETRQQFREASKIAMEDLVEARRVVKKLGGNPDPIKDWSRFVR